jgi:hypothetical protein
MKFPSAKTGNTSRSGTDSAAQQPRGGGIMETADHAVGAANLFEFFGQRFGNLLFRV